jgi:uncharacterized delta-60 repeat protein
MKISIDFGSMNASRIRKGGVALGLIAAVLYPAWLAASTVTGLLTFHPGEVIRSADLNNNFSALQTAVDGTDAQVTALSGNVTTLSGDVTTLQGNVTTLQGNVTTLTGNLNTVATNASVDITMLQNQASILAAQNASLLARLNVLQSSLSLLGPSGYVQTTTAVSSLNGIAIDSAGRILLTGSVSTNQMILLRLLPNGALDKTLGGTGMVMGIVGTAGNAVAIDAAGNIVVAGSGGTALELWRFLSTNGLPDSTFGPSSSGFVTIVGPAGTSSPAALAFDSGGRIFVSGQSDAPSVLTVWCFTKTGLLDVTFNSAPAVNGIIEQKGTGPTDPVAGLYGNGIALDPTGNSYVVGTQTLNSNMAVWSYDPNGGLRGGVAVVAPPGLPNSIAFGVLVDPQGRVVISGQSGTAPVVMATWRVTPAGITDTTFNAGGPIPGTIVNAGAGTPAQAFGVALDALGRIVVGGQSAAQGYPTVWRLTDAGVIDPTFGPPGVGFEENTNIAPVSARVAFAFDGRPTFGADTVNAAVDYATIWRFD